MAKATSKKRSKQMILCLDQGTTGTTALVLDKNGRIVAAADQDFKQIYPKPGWVEHRPDDIWKSVEFTVKSVLKKAKIKGTDIKAIGMTNQRETSLIWDRKTHRPVHNALVWQDRRTADDCKRMKDQGLEPLIKEKTGLLLDPYFSATKLRWLLDNNATLRRGAEAGDLAAGTIDTFLIWRLSGGTSHITDVSNASRTLLMDLRTQSWDPALLKFFQVPKELLPTITDSSGLLAYTKGLKFLPDGIPIAGVAGDQQSALFGQVCFEPGEAKCTYGTGSFLLMNTGERIVASKNGLLSTAAWRLPGQNCQFALEGGAFICGAAVQFLRDQLGFIRNSSEVEKLARSVTDTAGVEFVPALTGLGAPYWDPHARGVICGLTRGSTRAHIARATLEAMALQNVDILHAMQTDLGEALKIVRVDGGATANDLLMQLQADYLGVPVVRPRVIETTALGAGFLAGLGTGLFESMQDLKSVWKTDRVFKPEATDEARRSRLETWHVAVRRAKTNPT